MDCAKSMTESVDDQTQTAVFLAYEPEDEQDEVHEQRVEAYRTAWNPCLKRINDVVRRIYEPVVEEIVKTMKNAHNPRNTLPGLPYAELPVVAVHNATAGPFVNNLLKDITKSDVVLASLYPSDAPNISTALKSLISALTNTRKTKAPRAAAAYDIAILRAWYAATHANSQTHLIVVLHEFEHFDSSTINDLVEVCSTQVPDLPLTFLLFLASPRTPSYIHATFPRVTLARIRLCSFDVPGGQRVLDEVILQTFFSLEYDPPLSVGPTTLAYIADHYARHHSSINILLSMLQLTFLKHFLTHPLASFTFSSWSQNSSDTALFNLLRARLSSSQSTRSSNQSTSDPQSLLSILTQAHVTFTEHSRRFRLGITFLLDLNGFLLQKGHDPLKTSSLEKRKDQNMILNVNTRNERTMIDFLIELMRERGRVGKDVKAVCNAIKHLNNNTFDTLLQTLHAFLESIPGHMKSYMEVDSQAQFYAFLDHDEDEDDRPALDPEEFAQWLESYLLNLLQPLDDCPLWDLWYTGLTTFPSELLNPSMRSTIISALLRPSAFAASLSTSESLTLLDSDGAHSPTVSEYEALSSLSYRSQDVDIGANLVTDEAEPLTEELPNLPDTSILFRRYLDSGRVVNVYDWFEAFKGILDVQRLEENREPQRLARLGKGKGKVKEAKKARGKVNTKKPKENTPVDLKPNEQNHQDTEDQDKWNQEVQARFIRAFQELDYLGFIKHVGEVGKRRGCVVRTVFDVGEDEEGGE